jgi:hypothetical protein
VSASSVPAKFDPRADVNGDGTVNILDLSRVASQYNQTGNNLMGDIDASGRVDIFDLTRAAGSSRGERDPGLGGSLPAELRRPLRFHLHRQGRHPRSLHPLHGRRRPQPCSEARTSCDAYYVVKDQAGNIAARGSLGVTGNEWDIVLRKDADEITPGLMSSFRVNVTVYTQAPDGHWAMNTRDVGLSVSIGELLDRLK